MILSKIVQDNFHGYLNFTDPLINPFLFLSVIVKEFMIKKSSVIEIKNLVVNPKSCVKSNSKQ